MCICYLEYQCAHFPPPPCLSAQCQRNFNTKYALYDGQQRKEAAKVFAAGELGEINVVVLFEFFQKISGSCYEREEPES